MRAIVIGSAAGGGFPQWNCGCEGCVSVRAGRPGYLPRTQDSVAVTADGERFVLLNASPDVHAQIKATPALWPKRPRHTPIAAIVLTNGDLDHVLGLFSLRESQPLAVYATDAVWRGLESSVFIRTLRRFDGQLVKRVIEPGVAAPLEDAAGDALGLRVEPFAAAGKLPVHLMGQGQASPGDAVGLALFDTHASSARSLAYAAAFGSLEGMDLRGHGAVLVDGTFFAEDELVRQGLSKSVARDMAHLPIESSMRALATLDGRKIYTHINNTNPILAPDSKERRAVEQAGFEIAYDGMEIVT